MDINSHKLDDFKKLGYFIHRKLINDYEISELKKFVLNIIEEKPKELDFYYEKNSINKSQQIRRIEQLYLYNNFIHDRIFFNEIISNYLYKIFDNHKPVLFKDKLNLKYPGGLGFDPHIDGHFFWKSYDGSKKKGWLEYANFFVNVIITIDSSNENNGCLFLSDLSETKKYFNSLIWDDLTNDLKDNGPFLKDNHIKNIKKFPLLLEPGDVVFFDWRLPHSSEKNLSSNKRNIIYSTYCSSKFGNPRSHYFEDKRKSIGNDKSKSLIND